MNLFQQVVGRNSLVGIIFLPLAGTGQFVHQITEKVNTQKLGEAAVVGVKQGDEVVQQLNVAISLHVASVVSVDVA